MWMVAALRIAVFIQLIKIYLVDNCKPQLLDAEINLPSKLGNSFNLGFGLSHIIVLLDIRKTLLENWISHFGSTENEQIKN
jgi:hypothetical protein